MSTKTKAVVLVASFAVLLFMVVGEIGGVRASSNDGAYRQLEVYSEVLSRVRSEYVEDPNIPAVTDGALHGLLESLDAISKRFGYATVISVVPGGPADKVGVEGGDIFEAIEGKSTRDMSLAEIRAVLGGDVGSNVTV